MAVGQVKGVAKNDARREEQENERFFAEAQERTGACLVLEQEFEAGIAHIGGEPPVEADVDSRSSLAEAVARTSAIAIDDLTPP
jgi:hypothetical protein